ncbi:glycosyltransferase family 2 protein [Aquabacter cavernae]|uniref:glycosyltransferase family 2 protein n=1 Tax=Aquabacter cavernae TaxID=2496029 RepID=UPI0013DFA0DD|nr:glycosyltransferase family 2 protein [Aquabacter cavernae]
MLQGPMVRIRESAPAQAPHGIGPVWLSARPEAGGTRRFVLPLALRLWLAQAGGAYVLDLADAPTGPDGITLDMLDAGGQVLASTRIAAPLEAVFLPKGTAAITAPLSRLGFYPRSKLGLKLHAMLAGSFPGLPPLRRWKEAGAAARDLRGAHAALMENSPARLAERATAYRAYRAKHVEDFAHTLHARRDLSLCFAGPLPPAPAEAGLRLTALQAQTDPNWMWHAALPTGAPPALAQWARTAAKDEPRLRLFETSADDADALRTLIAGIDRGLVCLLPASGQPTRDAVAMIRDAFARHPDCRLAYTDEEVLDAEGRPEAGLFKPAFNRHLLQAEDYLGHLVAARVDAVQTVGGIDPYHGPAARYHLLLRLAETLPAAAIRHIPRVAFSDRPSGLADPHPAARALEEVVGTSVTIMADGRLRPLPPMPSPQPLVSFVVPTRDRADLMGMALRSLIGETDYRNFEIVIVDNGSVEPATFALFEEIKAAWPDTVVVRDDGPFNYPRICNAGVAAARGSLICLLNNDIEVVDGRWLDEMVALASLPRTGIVGAKLLFPDRTIQHAGVMVGLFRYAAHWFSHADRDLPGPFGRLVARANVSAVTGACLMIRRDVWEKTGPLDAERFAEDCNDIDLCLRARRAGYEVVFTPFACLIHHESASRGRKRSRAHRNRLKAQRRRMEDLWGTRTLVDPHYNPNLSRVSLHATLAAAPEGPRDPRTDGI